MADQPSIICPRCGRESYHPEDIRQKYCGYCHWWTSDPTLGPQQCACGEFLHYTDPAIERYVTQQVEQLGEYTPVVVPGLGVWMVQRHYIALHGLKAADLPTLGFRQVESVP